MHSFLLLDLPGDLLFILEIISIAGFRLLLSHLNLEDEIVWLYTQLKY